MNKIKRIFGASVLVVVLLGLFGIPAYAAVSDWTIVAQIDGLSIVGRTAAWQNGSYMCGASATCSGYMSNGVWQPYDLPAGYLQAYVYLVSGNGEVKGFSTLTSGSSTAGVVPILYTEGTSGMAYLVTGGGSVYNWHSGSCFTSDYGYSVAVYQSRSLGDSSFSLAVNALNGADIFMAGTHAYSLTSSGETYGSILYEKELGLPDWIDACATNGEHGYIDADDFWVPTPQNPADAVANFSGSFVRTIPVYDEPGGTTVVGWFDMHYGGSEAV